MEACLVGSRLGAEAGFDGGRFPERPGLRPAFGNRRSSKRATLLHYRGLILPLANTTRPSTIVLFTRPVRICPDHGELLDLLNPAFAS